MPAAVPTPEQVTAYLAAHSLEATIEDAVNDAVLKQVKVSCRRRDFFSEATAGNHASP